MEFIAELHNITVILDEVALNDEGIARDEPLNRIISGIKLRSALKIVLEPLACTYQIEDEVLKITTKVAAGKKLVTRVYDVRNLAEAGYESEALMGVITDTIRVDSWRNLSMRPEPNKELKIVAGKASIASLPGCLVISQSPNAHLEIVQLLRKLQHFAK